MSKRKIKNKTKKQVNESTSKNKRKNTKCLTNEAIYDPYDTVPVRDVEIGDDVDDHLLAVKYAEENNLGPNDTIVNTFTPTEKTTLRKMMRKGEFTQLECAIIRSLMSEAATLEDLGAMIGAVSRRTEGKPLSKPGALKELNRILEIVAKRSKAVFGKEVDLNNIKAYEREAKKNAEFRKKKAREAKRYANQQEKEFYRLLKELHDVQDEHGLARSKYYVRHFAPKDRDINQISKFGGKPDRKD